VFPVSKYPFYGLLDGAHHLPYQLKTLASDERAILASSTDIVVLQVRNIAYTSGIYLTPLTP
jgi:hypothetical protein